MKTPELLPPREMMYRALVDRDPSFEGIFYAGVRTTGIFCRPTCTAKKPERANVDFFSTASEALHGGYRPCLRCHPMDPDQAPPKLIARLGEEVDRAPGGRLTDKELAAMSIDPSTARRQFKHHYGMTFQAYYRARRIGLALRGVQNLRAGSAMLSLESSVKCRRRPESKAACLPRALRLRSVRCLRSLMTKDFVCSSSLIAARWNASCRSYESGCGPMSCLASTNISTRFVRSWPTIFRERILSLVLQWHPSVRHFNCALGNY